MVLTGAFMSSGALHWSFLRCHQRHRKTLGRALLGRDMEVMGLPLRWWLKEGRIVEGLFAVMFGVRLGSFELREHLGAGWGSSSSDPQRLAPGRRARSYRDVRHRRTLVMVIDRIKTEITG